MGLVLLKLMTIKRAQSIDLTLLAPMFLCPRHYAACVPRMFLRR